MSLYTLLQQHSVCEESVAWAKGLTDDKAGLEALTNPEWLMVLGSIQTQRGTLTVDQGLAMVEDVLSAYPGNSKPHQDVRTAVTSAKAAGNDSARKKLALRACMAATSLVRPLLGTPRAVSVSNVIRPHLDLDALD